MKNLSFKNNLKSKIQKRELVVGSWLTLAHPAIAEIMSKAGFDWIAIDLEHSVINIREAEEMIRVIELSGCSPLVRLTSNNADLIKRVMDAGAHGIIVPMVNSAEDARKAINSVRYPPVGERGVGLSRAQGYGVNFSEYKDWLIDKSVVIVQIEHIDAVENFNEILSVEGVDGFIVGPYDLSASMGIPGDFEHKDFIEIMKEIDDLSKKLNSLQGIHIIEPNPEQLSVYIAQGYKFIAYSLDIRMIDTSCRTGISEIKLES